MRSRFAFALFCLPFKARAMATNTSTPCDGNTLRDGSTNHMEKLNGRTAPLGTFGVSIWRPKIDMYNYKRNNDEKEGDNVMVSELADTLSLDRADPRVLRLQSKRETGAPGLNSN